MDGLKLTDFFNLATLPPALLIILYLITKYGRDLFTFGTRIYEDKTEDRRDRREDAQQQARSEQEFRQERDLLEWEKQAQDLATYRGMQREMNNQALEIAREQLAYSREDISTLQKTVDRQGKAIEHMAKHTEILAGAIDKLRQEFRARY